MTKDTLRILVSWKCNLDCNYCCNKLESVRKEIRKVKLGDIKWADYKVVCITGGEPLLFPDRVIEVCKSVAPGTLVVLYTNGIGLSSGVAKCFEYAGINAVNVGVHPEDGWYPGLDHFIEYIYRSVSVANLKLRFHVQDRFRENVAQLEAKGIEFRFWKMNDCERENEDRVCVEGWE